MTTEEKLLKIPILGWLVKLLKKIKVPGLEGMSLYNVLEMYVLGIVKGALTSRAGGIAFSFFMALFPFALFILTLIPFITIEGFQDGFMDFIHQALPPQTYDAVDSVLNDIINNKYSGLLSFGFVFSIVLMTNGVNALFGGFEYSYHKMQPRSMIRQFLVSMAISIILALLLLLTVAVIIYFEVAISNFKEKGYVSDDLFWIDIGKYVIVLAMILITVALFYFFGTKEGRKISFFSPGAILTTLLLILNFKLFGIYVRKFAQYNELYGAVGTLLVLMLFIWLNSIILLLGFELNAAIIGLKRNITTKNRKE
ncbi:YihY/virulence factor BrkB family protein [Aureibaculum marinum]|uniref:YihY/virulence factor BrkB family protein n=1 Tax=Aureibaculum marinum TaxID=2487930 RepID=A0A3N4NRB3_9FLAO|nr:YihY/virulence factor BrkB family protein [Aureibaculum marinum]RPD98754.1 YihY/virulence factor BrkB family protein [Aureibaculum marinum]